MYALHCGPVVWQGEPPPGVGGCGQGVLAYGVRVQLTLPLTEKRSMAAAGGTASAAAGWGDSCWESLLMRSIVAVVVSSALWLWAPCSSRAGGSESFTNK